MSKEIAEDFDGFIMRDGELVSIKDTDRIFSILVKRNENVEVIKVYLWSLAKECEGKGYYQAVYDYCEKLLSLAEEAGEKANCFWMMGLAGEKVEDYAAALEAYSRALTLPQDSHDIWYFLNNNAAFCLNQLGRYGEAEKYCRIAIKIEPGRHNAYKNLGVSLQNQCLYPEAARNFFRAIKLCPTDHRALEHLKELIADHPEILKEIPDLWELLESNGTGQETEGEFRLQ